ncbi:hypothetical protein GCM10023170_003780 [Phytohabitans houttuyneae]|uniref:Uncharacterized protein n=1 Tax=Phytohabitans houttuyneae TaxID=1076126 RepID=A0A6V8K5G4_9ACTN|nr:hypothetical protein Phou_029200 [Phytohabitans houttuyneae]
MSYHDVRGGPDRCAGPRGNGERSGAFSWDAFPQPHPLRLAEPAGACLAEAAAEAGDLGERWRAAGLRGLRREQRSAADANPGNMPKMIGAPSKAKEDAPIRYGPS